MSMMETLMQAAADSVRSQAEDLRLKDASLKDLREGLSDRTSRKTGSETKPSDRLRYELAQIPGASWPLLIAGEVERSRNRSMEEDIEREARRRERLEAQRGCSIQITRSSIDDKARTQDRRTLTLRTEDEGRSGGRHISHLNSEYGETFTRGQKRWNETQEWTALAQKRGVATVAGDESGGARQEQQTIHTGVGTSTQVRQDSGDSRKKGG
ncbi:hypothetical protein D9619_007956 [Psilocybe cf. subviscida]|uniref:Uncharacterized protein n=1 Tax=Psilocybe cf. subviscida TaxID=2480587 RepID=A0A8H5AT73_9AGAR|nr:hypothetical protein D9619_007956 [Psilocybe cf. subviscida]